MSDFYCACGLLAYTCGECNMSEPIISAELALGTSSDELTALRAENEKLRAELENERVRHAACGVIAMANTPDSAATQRQMSPKYWTASVQEVAKAVDREMVLHSRVERLEELLGMARNYLEGLEIADEIDAALAQQDEQEG